MKLITSVTVYCAFSSTLSHFRAIIFLNSHSFISVHHLRNLCFSASSQLILLLGTQSSILDIKSAACLTSSFYKHNLIVRDFNRNLCGTYGVARVIDNLSKVSFLDVVQFVYLVNRALVHRW